VIPEQPFRMTEQRRIILEELTKLNTHPTADELYELVREHLPNISLGTVYRNLEILSSAGMIQKLEMSGNQKRFDATLENHYHVRCMKCNRVDDVSMEPIGFLDDAAKTLSDYSIISHRLEFVGICPRCTGKEPRGSESPTRH
jgi:Fur family transcriptional regulator, ferric uptake regulator